MEFDAIPAVSVDAVTADDALCEEGNAEVSDIGEREVLKKMPRKIFEGTKG